MSCDEKDLPEVITQIVEQQQALDEEGLLVGSGARRLVSELVNDTVDLAQNALGVCDFDGPNATPDVRAENSKRLR